MNNLFSFGIFFGTNEFWNENSHSMLRVSRVISYYHLSTAKLYLG